MTDRPARAVTAVVGRPVEPNSSPSKRASRAGGHSRGGAWIPALPAMEMTRPGSVIGLQARSSAAPQIRGHARIKGRPEDSIGGTCKEDKPEPPFERHGGLRNGLRPSHQIPEPPICRRAILSTSLRGENRPAYTIRAFIGPVILIRRLLLKA